MGSVCDAIRESPSNGLRASWAHITPKRAVTSHPRSGAGLKLAHWFETASPPPRAVQPIRIATNLVGAGGAAYFSYSYLTYFVHSRQPLGAVFFAQQMIVVIAYLVRRPAVYVTRRVDDWLLAFGGTFAGVLARTSGLHPAGWVQAGLALQLIGAATAIASLAVLGRSFGFAAANRGWSHAALMPSFGIRCILRTCCPGRGFYCRAFRCAMRSSSAWDRCAMSAEPWPRSAF